MKNLFLKIFYIIRKLPILKRLTNSLLRRILFKIKKEKFFYNYKNVKFFLNIRDSIDRELFMNGYYEEKQLNILSKSIKKYSINNFIDIGSNIGIYSMVMAKNHSNLTIHAFEPHKDAFKRLKENVSLNNFGNRIHLYDHALSNKNGDNFLEAKNRFGLSQSGGAKISDKGNIKIKYKIGDDLLKIKKEHIAIKIDTEGHELFVLHGIKDLLSDNKVFLQIEIFPENIIAVTQLLNNLGFKLITKSQFTHQKNILDYFFEKNFS
tara:strand:+ start:1731 stop:2522 length:792 start_codon:yes stop_codon:yes gene_type:complete